MINSRMIRKTLELQLGHHGTVPEDLKKVLEKKQSEKQNVYFVTVFENSCIAFLKCTFFHKPFENPSYVV